MSDNIIAMQQATVLIVDTQCAIIHRIEGDLIYDENTDYVIEQANWIRVAAVARYNVSAMVSLFTVLLESTLEYPAILDTDVALIDWANAHMTDKSTGYYEAADITGGILSELGDVALEMLILLAENYTESTRIELVVQAIAAIGGTVATRALERIFSEYPVFKQPYFSSPDMAWQLDMWRDIANRTRQPFPPTVYIGGDQVSLRKVMLDVQST